MLGLMQLYKSKQLKRGFVSNVRMCKLINMWIFEYGLRNEQILDTINRISTFNWGVFSQVCLFALLTLYS